MRAHLVYFTTLALSWCLVSCEVDSENANGVRMVQLRPAKKTDTSDEVIQDLSKAAILMRTVMPSEAMDVKCPAYAHLFHLINRREPVTKKVVQSLSEVIVTDRLLYYKLFLDKLEPLNAINFVDAIEQLENMIPKRTVFDWAKEKSGGSSDKSEAAMLDLLGCMQNYMASNVLVADFLAQGSRQKLAKKAAKSEADDHKLTEVPQKSVAKIVNNVQNGNKAEEIIESLDDAETAKARQDLAKIFTAKMDSMEQLASESNAPRKLADLDNPQRLRYMKAFETIGLRFLDFLAMEMHKGVKYPPMSQDSARELIESWDIINEQSMYLPRDARVIRSDENNKTIVSKIRKSLAALEEAKQLCDELEPMMESPKSLDGLKEKIDHLRQVMAEVSPHIDAGEVGRRVQKLISKNTEFHVMDSFINGDLEML